MLKHFKKHGFWMLLGAALLGLVIFVFASGETAFDGYIKEVQTGGGSYRQMETGQIYQPAARAWVSDSGRCFSSDPAVAVVNKKGDILAVAPGEAYVVYMGLGKSHSTFHIVVNGEPLANADAAIKSHGATATTKYGSNLKAAASRVLGTRIEIFGKFIILLCIWLTICAGHFTILAWKLRLKPNEKNAATLADMLKSVSKFSKVLIYSNMYKFGVRFEMLRETFNEKVNPDPEISEETKRELYEQLRSIKVYGLNKVIG